MKIAINFCPHQGPWGGGNRFVVALIERLELLGHTVLFNLKDRFIDLILIIDPRHNNPNVTFTSSAILRYLCFKNREVIVVHRINECDERKNSRHMNKKLKMANYCADHTVFVGTWLKTLDIWHKEKSQNSTVILNGADTRVFHSNGWKAWKGDERFRLVTHHWGNNWMKGFDIYGQLDKMLSDPFWRDRLHFTYIGNIPKGYRFENSTHIEPLDGEQLADELRTHHGYITASINEPGGNHQTEGALCGLPLLYRDSGCMPEYCEGYGYKFNANNFENELREYLSKYQLYVPHMETYPHRMSQMLDHYLCLFDKLLANRKKILEDRKLFKNPIRFLYQLASIY